MDYQKRKEFLKNKLSQQGCTEEELRELYFLIDEYGSREELDMLELKIWKSKTENKQLNEFESDVLFNQIKRKAKVPEHASKSNINKHISFGYQQISRIAASILLLITFTWVTINYLREKDKAPEIKYITKSTNKGQRANITLNDGSVVTLNAESSITYPEVFADTLRSIVLKGEAFFDVAKNPKKPFVVESNGLLTTVLGTSFNIMSFSEKHTEVTVATGRVKVAPKLKRKQQVEEAVLIPNQQASFNAVDLSIMVSEVDLTPYLAWKNNALYFDMVPFSEVVKTLERWYNIEIVMKNKLADNCLVRAKYKNEALTNVLDGLKLLVNFDYKLINDKQVIITGRQCKN